MSPKAKSLELNSEVTPEVTPPSRLEVLGALGVIEDSVLSYIEYSISSVVVVTTAGVKLLWGDDPNTGSLYHNKQKPAQKKS